MAGDELATLGLQIRGEAAEWLGGLLAGWTLPGADAAIEPIAELVILERAVAALAGQVAELEELEAALTAGFPGTPSPALSADAAANEEAEPRTGRRGSDTGPWIAPSPSTPADRRTRDGVADAQARPPRVAPVSRAAESGRETAAGAGSVRTERGVDASPSPGGGIRGIGDLASLAGSAGLDLPPDADQPNAAAHRDLPRAVSDGSAGRRGWEDATGSASAPRPSSAPVRDDAASGRTAGRTRDDAADPGSAAPQEDASRDLPGPAPIRRPARDQSASGGLAAGRDRDAAAGPAGHDADTGPAREFRVDSDDHAARDERRWDDLPPSLAGVARNDALTLGLLGPGSVALPFLSIPGEPDADADSTSPERGGAVRASGRGSIDRDRIGSPAPWRRDEAAAGRPAIGESGGAAAQGWIDEFGGAANPLVSPGLARAAGRRVRPAAEILSALGEGALTVESAPRLEGSAEWPTLAPEPVERPAAEPGAAPDPRPRAPDDEPPVAFVRSVEPAPPDAFPEPLAWPDLDVQDLMDALAREIMHEYRRYYG